MKRALVQFFSGVFHQDWDAEAPTAEELIKNYRATVPPEKADLIARLIGQELIRSGLSDERLSDALYDRYGCHYDPTADGISVRTWLERISEQLATPSTSVGF